MKNFGYHLTYGLLCTAFVNPVYHIFRLHTGKKNRQEGVGCQNRLKIR